MAMLNVWSTRSPASPSPFRSEPPVGQPSVTVPPWSHSRVRNFTVFVSTRYAISGWQSSSRGGAAVGRRALVGARGVVEALEHAVGRSGVAVQVLALRGLRREEGHQRTRHAELVACLTCRRPCAPVGGMNLDHGVFGIVV